MKVVKYTISFWTVLLLSIVCFSCMDDELEKANNNWSDGKTLVLSLNTAGSPVVSPMTRSAKADTMVTSVYVLIYKAGTLFDVIDLSSEAGELSKGNTVTRSVEVGKDAIGKVYAIANWGQGATSELKEKFNAEESLQTTTFGNQSLNDKDKQYKVPERKLLYASGQEYNVGDGKKNKPALALKRIYAMITVELDKKQLSSDIKVIPTSVQLKHVPKTGRFGARPGYFEGLEGNFIPRPITGGADECEIDGDIIRRSDEKDDDFLKGSHSSSDKALYMYENRQPENKKSKDDQTKKAPYYMEPGTISDLIKTDRTCSYIELKALYIKDGKPSGVGSGTVVYRFFLGKNVDTNFDVECNTHYKLTLALHGEGGIDEGTWRVETDLMGDINAPDIYIGYRAGSTSEMVVTGDIEEINGDIVITGDFEIMSSSRGDKDWKIVVRADKTNINDYGLLEGTATFTLNSGGTKTAKIYQVPRLVDPIAFYKRAANVDPVNVVVKAFNPEKRAYETLESIGPWCAIIESSQDETGGSKVWFKIHNDKGTANSLKDTIWGEGEVKFVYTPISANSSGDNMNSGSGSSGKGQDGNENTARYGKITVKYHNANCAHDIYLRQGYQPTSLGDNDFAWSMFNSQGKDKKGVMKMAAFPTQTGWFFKGGNDLGIHPFKPGYGESSEVIECSDGELRNYLGIEGSSSSSDWTVNMPCPKGYKVADAKTYFDMVENSEVYTGFVHDDDPISGWQYDGVNVRLDNNNSCNPAKGSLFIDKSSSKNIFFSFGKGVLEIGKIEKDKQYDKNLIDEIGVGRRYSNRNTFGGENSGALRYEGEDNSNNFGNPAYGTIYWNAKGYYGGPGWRGKVDFSYNIFTRKPYQIDYISSIEGGKADGMNPTINACFVRCVKDLKSLKKELIIPKGTNFKFGSRIASGLIPVYLFPSETLLESIKIDELGKSDSNINLGERHDVDKITFQVTVFTLTLTVKEIKERIERNEDFVLTYP